MLPARADAEIYLISRTTLFSYQQVTIQQPGLHLEFRHFEKRVITTQYRYDPLTRRISRSTGAIPSAANTYQFAFSGSSPVHEWDGDISNTSYHQQRTGSGVGGLLQTQEADGTATHPRHNLRGDITAQFSETGTLLWHGSYASNGILNHQYGTRNGKYGANGKYEEPAGLINEGFRYRDRLTNTFITRDPAGFIDGKNDYNYVKHNTWSSWDPNGLASVLIPQTTGDIGYISPDAFKSTAVPPAMDGNSLSNQTSPISQNGYQGGAGSSQTLPDYKTFPDMEYWDLLSAIVEANAEPITISNAPTNIWLLLSEGSHEQLVHAHDSGNFDAETKRAIENAIESRANGAHNWAVVSGTAQGLTMILQPESVAFKGAAIGFIGLKSLGRSALYAERLGAFGIRSESAAAKSMVASLEETVGSFNSGSTRTLNYSFGAKMPSQLEFDFVKNLENPKFVLYKTSEFNRSMLRPGEYTLNLPWLRNEALDWTQNQKALQRAMDIGNPIREANPNALGGWLQRERDFLSSQRWQRIQQGSDVFWVKPSAQ